MIEGAQPPGDLEGIESRIRQFVVKAFKGHSLGDDDDIFSTGFVNSLFAMELVTFIEGAFSVRVESDDLDLDNFRSIGSMTRFVAGKRGIGAPPQGASL